MRLALPPWPSHRPNPGSCRPQSTRRHPHACARPSSGGSPRPAPQGGGEYPMLTSFDQKQASSNIGLNWLLDGSPNDVLPASCYLESRPRYIKRFSTQKVLLKHPQTQSAAVPLSCSYLEACNTDQKYNPKALSTFFRSSGFPFFTLHNTRSPGEQLGNLFKRPPMPITAKMYRFLGPETKEVNKKPALGV